MLIDGPEEDDEIDDDGECPEETHEETVEEGVEEDIQAEISMHAYSSTFAPRTLRVDGLVRKHCVHILIDSGSTHNFLEETLVRRLGLDAELTTGFDVAIGDGTKLKAESLCR